MLRFFFLLEAVFVPLSIMGRMTGTLGKEQEEMSSMEVNAEGEVQQTLTQIQMQLQKLTERMGHFESMMTNLIKKDKKGRRGTMSWHQKTGKVVAAPKGGQWTNGYGKCNKAKEFTGKDDRKMCIPKFGVTCAGYVNEGWCTDGKITQKYKRGFKNWKTGFNRPADHCPDCGKPTCADKKGFADVGGGPGKLVGWKARMGRKLAGGKGPGEAKSLEACRALCEKTDDCTDFDYCDNGTCSRWQSEAGKSIKAKYDYYPKENCRSYVCGPHY